MNQFRFGMRELIFMGVLLAVPIASYFFVFSPRNGQIRSAKSEISQKETRLAELRKLTSRIPDLDKEIVQWADSIRRLEEKLPDQEGVDAILGQITQIAQDNKLLVRSIKGEKAVPAAMAMELPLRTTVEGDFRGFYKFLLGIESLPRITRIHQLKMSRLEPSRGDDKPAEPGTMKAEFVLSIYFDAGDQPQFETIGGKRDTQTRKRS
ncbi:MAG: type 4a pilus biogenesis protein PilO [Phycisphaerae bacterium]|jgi:type IV pilus assembly protein PilO|nr:type 4a pilus biogenesis protein PilO [Phycisphaerae bacterium]